MVEWLVGRDTRESGPVLEQALVDGLRSGGGSPIRTGVIPTPALAYLSAQHNVPAAMITASHNPYGDNGVKIFGAGGLKLADEVEREIESAMEDPPEPTEHVEVVQPGLVEYCDHLVNLIATGSLDGLRIVLDCANGAMFEAAPEITRRLGADVVVINAEPNGRNINDHCGAMYPASLSVAVTDHGADLGLAFDGDGDRVIAVDNLGNVVDGDRMIALGALQLRDEGQLTNDTVVVTVMSNLGFHKAMAAAGYRGDHHGRRRQVRAWRHSRPATMRSAASRAGTSSTGTWRRRAMACSRDCDWRHTSVRQAVDWPTWQLRS